MPMANIRPLFTWRSAIVESALPPTARHVALTLSLHMNERGGSCFPSQATLAQETGLHLETVKTQLQRLSRDGWLQKTISRKGSGRGTRVEYEALIPTTTGAENTGAHDPCTYDHRGGGLSTTGVEDCGPPGSTTPVSSSSGVHQGEEVRSPIFDILLALRDEGLISNSIATLADTAEWMRGLDVKADRPSVLRAIGSAGL